MVSEDSDRSLDRSFLLILRTGHFVTALIERVVPDTRFFQHLVGFL